MTELQHISNKQYKYILVSLLVILGFILFRELKPYLSGFLGALTLYIIMKRQMNFFMQKMKFNRTISASIITIESLLFFIGPLVGISFLVIDTLSGVTIDTQQIAASTTNFIEVVEEKLGFKLFTPDNLSFLPKMGTSIVQSLGSSAYSLIINTIVMLFIFFYMLYNYDSFEKAIKEILPLKDENKQILSLETREIVRANAIGIPLLAIIQGLFAYLGYLFFGIENPLLYGVLTGVASIIPVLGTMIVWIPLSISLLIADNITGAIGLGLFGLIIIGGVDNVARFLLQKILADIHPLITVFGVLIGIPMFGFWGVIFGPLILSLFILFINMYRYEFIPGSSAQPRVTTKKTYNKNKTLTNIKIKKQNNET